MINISCLYTNHWPNAGLMLIQRLPRHQNQHRILRHELFTQCWFNVGPASPTLAQQQTNIGSTPPVSLCCINWLKSSRRVNRLTFVTLSWLRLGPTETTWWSRCVMRWAPSPEWPRPRESPRRIPTRAPGSWPQPWTSLTWVKPSFTSH